MTHSTIRDKQKKKYIKWLVLPIWLVIWQIAYLLVGQELLLASPVTVVVRLFELAVEGSFWKTVAYSCIRITTGFSIAMILGVFLAILTSVSGVAYTVLSPAMQVIKATPVASFIILALIWVRASGLSCFIAFLMVLPMVWTNIQQGIANTSVQLLEMGKVFHFSIFKKIRLIYIPSVMPHFISACTTGIGFAWKAGIAAEVIGIPKNAIGTQLYNAKIYLETGDLFAWTVVVILMSIVIEKLFIWGLDYAKKKLYHH